VDAKREGKGREGEEMNVKETVGKKKRRWYNTIIYINKKSMSFCTKLPGWRLQHISFVGTDRSQTFFSLSSHVHELE